MRILFLCDLNSIHSRKWITFFIKKRHEVFIYSTTPFDGQVDGAEVYSDHPVIHDASGWQSSILSAVIKLPMNQAVVSLAERIFLTNKIRQLRSETSRHAARVSGIIASIKPDIVHALRIPNEGFIGALTKLNSPLAISTWGNDLTYWGQMSDFRELTIRTLKSADFLFTDCNRDLKLGYEFGFPREKPHLVVPGAGGMFRKNLDDGAASLKSRTGFFEETLRISGAPVILSLRGFGSQDIDNIPLIHACKILASRNANFHLVIAGKKNGLRFHKLTRLIRRLKLDNRIILIDELRHEKALEALKGADFSVSVSRNDGTPNSMLEAMTFGSIPIMSNIDSIREWVTDGSNGYLFNPLNAESIAATIEKAILEKDRHQEIRKKNFSIVTERADYDKNMSNAEQKLMSLLGTR